MLDIFNTLAKISEQKLPEMGFVFHPTVLRVQQPHLILNGLRHFKVQLDHSPIMDALFSPATVPLPPAVPWPSNYIAQRYLPPSEVFAVEEFPVKQEMGPNDQHPHSYQHIRRTFPNFPSGNDIERSIAQSMAQNSARLQTQFVFPNFSNMRRNFQAIPSGRDIEKSIEQSMAQNSAHFQQHFNFPVFPDMINGYRRFNIPGISTGEDIEKSIAQSIAQNSLNFQQNFQFPNRMSHRRINILGMPSGDSIQKSIAESIGKNSALFGAQFIMPDISKAIDGLIQSHVSQNM